MISRRLKHVTVWLDFMWKCTFQIFLHLLVLPIKLFIKAQIWILEHDDSHKNIDDDDDDSDRKTTNNNISRKYYSVNNFNVAVTRLSSQFLHSIHFRQKFVYYPHAWGIFLP
jgi:hypothetical protein